MTEKSPAPVQEEATPTTGKIDSFADQTVRATSNKTGPGSPWVVWSKDHQAWWGPNRCGYAPNLFDAGLYEEADAKEIEAQSSPRAGSSLSVGSVSDEARRLSDEIKSHSRHNNVASLWPALLEASRERDRLQKDRDDLGATVTIYYNEMKRLGNELAGSISERETLTAALQEIDAIRNSIVGTQRVNWSAHIYPLVAALGKAGFVGLGYEKASAEAKTLIQQRDEAEAAVARLTTERDKFQEWFQNAEQARAVAESRLETVEAMREHYKADAIGCASQLVELQRVREQAIQDIEALATYSLNDVLLYRAAVLSILRGSLP